MDKKKLGNYGEDKAAAYLRRKGYKIVDRNFSCRFGELDIVAQKGPYIVFAEVKLRKNDAYGEAKEFVTAAKQRRIISAALLWLAQNNCEMQPRFDVIEVYAPEGENTRKAEIKHIEDAFGA